MAETVAITGASGFVGGRLARYLAERNYEVLAFGRRAVSNLPDHIKYASWDITNGPLVHNYRVDVVIHCAGSVTDWGSYKEMYAVNVEGTRNVLATFRDTRQFIHLSTASIYDPFHSKYRVREDAPYPARYLNEYALTKQQAELVVRENSHPNRVIVRPHIIYGPGDTTVLPRLLKARKFGRFVVIGDGENHISLTYIENLCYGLELIMQQAGGFEIFNLCDQRSDSVNRILGALLKNLGINDPLWHLDKRAAGLAGNVLQTIYRQLRLPFPPLVTPYIVAQMSNDYILDVTKIKERLGYRPAYDYEQGFTGLGSPPLNGKNKPS